MMRPCIRLVAGKKVLRVSMDTSSGRYSVAALLDDRVGVCWELNDVFNMGEVGIGIGESLSLGMHTHIRTSGSLNVGPNLIVPLPTHRNGGVNPPGGHRAVPEQNQCGFTFVNHRTSSPSTEDAELPISSTQRLSREAHVDDLFDQPRALPTRAKPNGVYRNLGCPNDPPRSVAVCPQRKCVAFGCQSGIELHWVDALTGGDLNRWFPLAAPTDFLYFLPRRTGVGSIKKLRLVSSAAGSLRPTSSHYSNTPSGWGYGTAVRRHGYQQKPTRLFSDSPFFPPASDDDSTFRAVYNEHEAQGVSRTVDCDHYRAVPLSDGVHVLFTDPVTGLLCLGSDAPLGGPTKLIRKICMIPPSIPGSPTGALVCYAAGHDLSWGVRVFAVYDDSSIILFHIPSDCFERIRYLRSAADVQDELARTMTQSDLLVDRFMLDGTELSDGEPLTGRGPNTALPTAFNSVQIGGAFVCQADDNVDDMQVDCHGGGLRVWIFYRNGKAKKLDIYVPSHRIVQSHVIGSDGLLHQESPFVAESQADSGAGWHNSSRRQEDDSLPAKESKLHVRFCGSDGTSDIDSEAERVSRGSTVVGLARRTYKPDWDNMLLKGPSGGRDYN